MARGGGAGVTKAGERWAQGVATADEPDRVRESGAEREYEPTPCRLLHRASRGGALVGSLCLTRHGCQVWPIPGGNGMPRTPWPWPLMI